MSWFWAALFLVGLIVSATATAFGAAPSCNAFSGGDSAGSVTVEEVLKRAVEAKAFDSEDLAPLDAERPARVESAMFGLG